MSTREILLIIRHLAPATLRLPAEIRNAYLDAIMNPSSNEMPRLECPANNLTRYTYLQPPHDGKPPLIEYFFALNLRQNLALLPRLIGSIVETIRFLGPERCALSIVEGNSVDGTEEVLAALAPHLLALGTTYHFRSSPINPKQKGGDRIVALAQLRNLALEPLFPSSPGEPSRNSRQFAPPADTTVIFLNDVAICPADILELVHQRTKQGADMVCAMDWTHVGPQPTFYDVWISRQMNGDSFFRIPVGTGSWDFAWDLFWNAEDGTKARFEAARPFQVFACWNGAVAFTAEPVMLPTPDSEGGGGKGVRFRSTRKGECRQGEPQLFCKDLWWGGWGKIAVVPSVNLEYTDARGKRIKENKGWVEGLIEKGEADGGGEDRIEWRAQPPDGVKCFAGWKKQFYQPWNHTQPGV